MRRSISQDREVDLHGLRLFEAELVICEALEEAWYNDEKRVLFIHGYKSGTDIRRFIWGVGGLRKKLKRSFPSLSDIDLQSNGSGSTYVIFRGLPEPPRKF